MRCLRCALLICMIVSFLVATAQFYLSGLHSYANAAMATLVLTGAELGAQICHEEEADIVEWVLAFIPPQVEWKHSAPNLPR